MKTCPNCGAQLPDAAEYCGNCGAYVGAGGQPLPPQPPPNQPYLAPGQPYVAPGDVYGQQQPPGYPPPYGQPQAYPTLRFAGFWIRFLALIIDGIVLGIVTIPVWIWFTRSSFWTTSSGGVVTFHWNALRLLLAFLVGLAYILYNTLMVGHYGATLGKMAVQIKVVRTDLTPVGYGWALLRESIGKWISGLICDLGYIWAGFDSRKQAWHDHIANTLVIYK